MQENRTDYVIRNLIYSLINSAIGTVMPFFVRTFTIYYLGSEYMGLNNLCTSILYVLNAADLGVANAFAFRLYKPMAQKDTDEVCRLLNFYKKVYTTIGLAILGMGLCLMPFLQHLIKGDLPEGINIYVVFFIYLVNSAISYMLHTYNNLLFLADQRRDYESNLYTINFIMLYGSQIAMIVTRHYYLSVIMFPVCTFFSSIIRNIFVKKRYPQYVPRGRISDEIRRSLWKDILSVTVYKLRDISRNSFDNIVISSFLGLVVLSNYQNYYMVVTLPNLLLSIFYNSIQPSMGNCIAMESVEGTYSVYKKNVFILEFLGGWFAICYGLLIQDFIVIWLGADYLMSDTLAILLALFIYLQAENLLAGLMREGAGLWKYGRICAVAEMAVNLVLNIVLLLWLGVEGIVLATILSMLFISIPAENFIIHVHFFDSKLIDRLKYALRSVLWTVTTALITGLICSFAPKIYGVRFVFKVFACAFIPPISLAVCFGHTEEFKFVKSLLLQILFRKVNRNKN